MTPYYAEHDKPGQLSQACPVCIGGRVDSYVGDRLTDRACGYCGGRGFILTTAPARNPVACLAADMVDQAQTRMDAAGIPKPKGPKMHDDRLGRKSLAMLKRIGRQEGTLLELQLTASGNDRIYSKLRRLGLVRRVDHPTVRIGGHSPWPADAVDLTEAGRAALAKVVDVGK